MALRYDIAETSPLADAVTWLDELNEVQRELAVAPTVPEPAEQRLWRVLAEVPTSPDELQGLDPYLAQALLGGAVQSFRALREPDRRVQRRSLRLAVEQLRQALRDALADEPVGVDRPAGAQARWLVDSLRVSVADLARVVGVSTRTFHRWMEDDTVEPSSKDGARLAMVARVANELRHVFTGPGVIGWLGRPSAALHGEAPTALLGDPARFPEVLAAARRYRAMVAA